MMECGQREKGTGTSDRLILFTRYPQAGTTKTRLIPELGPDGAALLHRQMAEYTLAQVKLLQQQFPLSCQIAYTGGTIAQMQDWLGSEWDCVPQGNGDLGDRMAQAFKAAFHIGMERVVIIGTDCPQISPIILRAAFQQLEHKDISLGPATDGGYYLIGLRSFIPDLFIDMPWSSDRVFQQTLNTAQSLQKSVACLPTLSDVDRPEDLPIWDRVKALDQL